MVKKLKSEDLKIGMRVTGEQLSSLYGVWVYVNPQTMKDGQYDIVYFCTEESKDDHKIDELRNQFGKVSVIYQPAYYEDEDVLVDE